MQVELNKCNDILASIYDAATSYYDKISDIVNKISPNNNYADIIKLINKKLKMPDDLLSHVELFDTINSITAYLNDISTMVSNDTYSKAALYSKSATYSLQLTQQKNIILQYIDKWSKINLDTLAVYDKTVDINELLSVASTHMNYFIISLIRKSYDRRLESVVEKQKDIALGSTSRIPNINAIGCQAIVTRGNLLPTNVNKSYDELLTLAKTGPNVILLRNGCPSPIIFNIEGLTSLDYITKHDLLTGTFTGLNKKIISRYNTVSIGDDTMPGVIEVITGIDTFYTIYENISGDQFRLLTIGGKDLLTEAQVKFTRSISTRPLQYSVKSYVSPIDPYYNMRVDRYTSSQINLSPDIIQRRIYEKFSLWFATIINIIDSNDSFHENIINRDKTNEIIIDVLTTETETYADYSDPEVMCSHIIKFESICREFIQLVEKQLLKINIPSRLFSEETRRSIEDTLHGYMDDIYKTAINEIGDRWADFDLEIKESFSKFIKN